MKVSTVVSCFGVFGLLSGIGKWLEENGVDLGIFTSTASKVFDLGFDLACDLSNMIFNAGANLLSR